MNTHRFIIAAISLVLAAMCLPAQAQNIRANVTAINHSAYAGIASQFTLSNLTVDGKSHYNGSGYLICADVSGLSLDDDSRVYPRVVSHLTIGTMEQMDVWNRYGNAQDESLSRAMVHWFIDNYYQSQFLNPINDVNARQYAFQNVIWEIFGDGGTTSGLNFNNGNIDRKKFGPYGTDSDPTLWSHMSNLLNAVKNSGVNASYIPKYEVLVALDSRSSHQDYLLLAANPTLMTIPEPSGSLLVILGSLVLLARRRS